MFLAMNELRKSDVTMLETELGKVVARSGQWSEGDRYTVAPCTLIVEGVLSGSDGPLFYPAEEIARAVAMWSGAPVTLGHPVHHGRPVSGSHPAAKRVGWVRNPSMVAGKVLMAEVWLDERLTPPALLSAVRKGKAIDVSTGLFVDADPVPPDTLYGDRRYHAVARRQRPDHLAILDGQEGACSVQDGCAINPRPNRAAMLVDNEVPGLPTPGVNWRAVWEEMCPTRSRY